MQNDYKIYLYISSSFSALRGFYLQEFPGRQGP